MSVASAVSKRMLSPRPSPFIVAGSSTVTPVSVALAIEPVDLPASAPSVNVMRGLSKTPSLALRRRLDERLGEGDRRLVGRRAKSSVP